MASGDPGRAQTLDESLLVDPESDDRPVRDFLRASPGRIALIAVVLIGALLLVGAAASKTTFDRQGRLETLRSHTEPLAHAAQGIYIALSEANTAAATSFLSGGVESSAVRARYDAAIGSASASLITAANGVSIDDSESLRLLTDISNQLAMYTGVAATARANNRSGWPIGVGYLSESSAMMTDDMLPDAQELHRIQSEQVLASDDAAGVAPGAVLAAVAVLVLLIGAQVYLGRLSRRRFNAGLVAATVLVGALALWLVVAGSLSARSAAGARSDGGEPLGEAVAARILVQQARAQEILGLLNRGAGDDPDAGFDSRTGELAQRLGQYPAEGAADALADWVRANQRMRELLAAGDYPAAVAVARDDAPGDAAPAFSRLDNALREQVAELRTRQHDGITHAYTALDGLPFGAAAIGILAALAVAGGVGPRLSEYH